MPSDNPVLVAPRPIRFNTLLARNRILSGPDLFERARVSEDISDAADDRKTPAISLSDSDKELSSPSARSSPRSLPTEALEEFLSILRPSFFPPSSPVLLTRRHPAVSLPALHQERPYSRKGRALLQDLSDDLDIARSTQSSRNMSTPDGETFDDYDMNTIPVRWFASNVLCM
ncbi:unnamed protein product [Mycena citricolor]|uniref:Uncharacterized protein n=1 Tax=Mycena citricolor TaxID=2018698 RepID=A0AAD2HNU5_9AGAR|nr:unnamed protein product [Mycena citricolor]